jgi:hypothetical protein
MGVATENCIFNVKTNQTIAFSLDAVVMISCAEVFNYFSYFFFHLH